MKSIGFVVAVFACGLSWAGSGADGTTHGRGAPKLWIESTAIDLGKIPVDQEKIEGVIRYMNEGDAVLEISNISGSCDCFLGFEGDKVLSPGHGGELFVKFDKTKIESGPVKRLVRFDTNDPGNKAVRVVFSFEIERTDSEEIRWLQKDLTEVKQQLALLRADMRKVLAAVEKGGAGQAAPAARANTAARPRVVDTSVYEVEAGTSPVLGKADAAGEHL